jgi:hypothetical protein
MESEKYVLCVHRNECKYEKILTLEMFSSAYVGFHEIPKIIGCQKIAQNISSFYTVKYDAICDKIILRIILVSSKTLWETKNLETITFYLTKVNEYIELLNQVNQLKVHMEKIEKCNIESRKVLKDAKKLMASLRISRQQHPKTFSLSMQQQPPCPVHPPQPEKRKSKFTLRCKRIYVLSSDNTF